MERVTLHFTVAVRFKVYVCGRLSAGITSSNPAESLDVLEFVVCCVVAV